MHAGYTLRPAIKDDARDIAQLIAISSDGVALIDWVEQARKQNCDPLDIGEAIYKSSEGDYSFKNVLIAATQGHVAGMLLSFAVPNGAERDAKNRPDVTAPNVFAPYMYLEEPDSWYVCGIAFYPEYRGQGLGTVLMQQAENQAHNNGFNKISLIAFKENTGSVRLYKRLGYQTIDHAPIIPHPLIHYAGNAILMIKNLDLEQEK